MTRYFVQLRETVTYGLYVDAESEDAAGELAVENWNQGLHDDGCGLGVETDFVNPLTPEEAAFLDADGITAGEAAEGLALGRTGR